MSDPDAGPNAESLAKLQAVTAAIHGNKHTIWYGFLALLTFMLMVKDYVVLEQGIEEDKNKTGQAMMISMSSMNFVFLLMFGAVGSDDIVINHPWIDRLFALSAGTYILLWYLQSSWVKDGIKWGQDMTELGKANFYMTLMFTLPYIYVIYTALAGSVLMSTKIKVIFALIVIVLLVLPFLIIKFNKK